MVYTVKILVRHINFIQRGQRLAPEVTWKSHSQDQHGTNSQLGNQDNLIENQA